MPRFHIETPGTKPKPQDEKELSLKGMMDAIKNFQKPKPEKLEPPRGSTGVRG